MTPTTFKHWLATIKTAGLAQRRKQIEKAKLRVGRDMLRACVEIMTSIAIVVMVAASIAITLGVIVVAVSMVAACFI